jgi:hypothetical protein
VPLAAIKNQRRFGARLAGKPPSFGQLQCGKDSSIRIADG